MQGNTATGLTGVSDAPSSVWDLEHRLGEALLPTLPVTSILTLGTAQLHLLRLSLRR